MARIGSSGSRRSGPIGNAGKGGGLHGSSWNTTSNYTKSGDYTGTTTTTVTATTSTAAPTTTTT